MASRKTAKKATKKTAPKKVVKKTAAKRSYVRKPKTEKVAFAADDLTVAVTEAAAEPQREESNYDFRDSIIESQAAILDSLHEQLTNPKNVALKLATLGPVVYLDTAHLDMNQYAVEKVVILHILGCDGYMVDVGDGMVSTSSLKAIKRLLGISVLKLNTVNRTVSVEVESNLPEGTVLTRIMPNLCTPQPSVESVARIVSHTVEIEGVKYNRSY